MKSSESETREYTVGAPSCSRRPGCRRRRPRPRPRDRTRRSRAGRRCRRSRRCCGSGPSCTSRRATPRADHRGRQELRRGRPSCTGRLGGDAGEGLHQDGRDLRSQGVARAEPGRRGACPAWSPGPLCSGVASGTAGAVVGVASVITATSCRRVVAVVGVDRRRLDRHSPGRSTVSARRSRPVTTVRSRGIDAVDAVRRGEDLGRRDHGAAAVQPPVCG